MTLSELVINLFMLFVSPILSNELKLLFFIIKYVYMCFLFILAL